MVIERLSPQSIFAYAVGLEQGGRNSNTIFCSGKVVFILNVDRTVLLRFSIRESSKFNAPVSFNANDYDSAEFEERDGVIAFRRKSESGTYERTKSCRVPNLNFQDVEDVYDQFFRLSDGCPSVSLGQDLLSLLEENLSHVEFSSYDGRLKIVQRDIFSGSLVEIIKRDVGLSLAEADRLPDRLGPFGMRTKDLFALFNDFNPKVTLYFPADEDYFLISGIHGGMTGIVSKCFYDEMGITLLTGKGYGYYGRQKQKRGNGEQEAGGAVNGEPGEKRQGGRFRRKRMRTE